MARATPNNKNFKKVDKVNDKTDDNLKLHLDVRGSEGIDFEEGSKTGDMKEYGLSIDTAWYGESRRRYGGCIDRTETKQLRDYLNSVIEKWENEDDNS